MGTHTAWRQHLPKGSRSEKNQSRLIFSIETEKLKKINRFLLIFSKINREKINRCLSQKSIDFCLKNQSIFCCVFPSFLLFWMGFLLNICASYFTYFHVYMCIYIYIHIMNIHTCIHIHRYIDIHIYIYMNTRYTR